MVQKTTTNPGKHAVYFVRSDSSRICSLKVFAAASFVPKNRQNPCFFAVKKRAAFWQLHKIQKF